MDAVAVQEQEISHHSQTREWRTSAVTMPHDLTARFVMLSEHPLTKGRVLLLFQPAEENGSGSKAVLDTKVLDYYQIDKTFALHNIPGYPLHAVLCKEGSFTCAVVSVSITLTGKTSHAAEPQKGISPIPAMLTIVDELSRWNNTDMQSDDYFLSTIVEIHVGEEAYG
ncbi:MAG: M20/M25/M40 family metallo-hydrolase, partial [Butyricimonas faecihominis]